MATKGDHPDNDPKIEAGGRDQQLEKAVESMYMSIDALGEVAQDTCDLGLIAVLNENGFRPLLKEFEAQAEIAEGGD